MRSVLNIPPVDGARVFYSHPLENLNSLKIGGITDIFVEVYSKAALPSIFVELAKRDLPHTVIGSGSNLIVSQEGYRGAIIKLSGDFEATESTASMFTAGAAIRMTSLVNYAINNNYSGFESLGGIPGTLGGALKMNAGAYGATISDRCISVEVYSSGAFYDVPKNECGFTYRSSSISGDVIISGCFEVAPGDVEARKEVRSTVLRKRNESQPIQMPNSGSVFTNPEGAYAAKLIQDVGLKGKRIGGAQISEKHANFIVNLGTASSHDVVALMIMAKEKVYQKFNIHLRPEVKLIGFSEDVVQKLYASE